MPTVPDLYVRQSPHPNAYTLAVNGRRPFIVVHTALVELLTPQELKVGAVLRFETAVLVFPATAL
jgi:Zn-dependent protease with chaperone function